MLRLDDLRDAVDPSTGALSFAVPIATLEGITGSGWTLALAYDSTSVDATVPDWNLSRPTHDAGLGWSLELDHIEVRRGDPLGSDESTGASRYVLQIGARRYELVPAGGGVPAAQAYATRPYEFWRIVYEPQAERWTVTLEDGTTLVFGDAASGRETVDRGYEWAGWIGATLRAADRRPVATGWWLSRRADVWGNACTFTYEQTRGELGSGQPVPYTRATRLTRVDGPTGHALTLLHAAKQPDEYGDPHPGPSGSAWQSRFSTTALAAVSELAPGGTIVATTTLQYAGPGGTLAAIGTGDHTKRLLTGMVRNAPEGYELPGLSFAYDVDPTSPAYGALTRVTTVAGGEAAIAYARQDLPLPLRDATIQPPAAGFGSPRVAVGDDYAVALWRGAGGVVKAMAYRWQGRWLAAEVAAPPAADEPAYAALRIVPGLGCFAIVGASEYTLFHADPSTPGAWVGSDAPEPIVVPAGEPVVAVGGAGYIALAGAHGGATTVRWFDGSAWQALPCPAPAGARLAAIDGSGSTLVRVTSAGGSEHGVLIAHPTAQGWASTSFPLSVPVAGLDAIAVDAGATYAIVTLTGRVGDDRTTAWEAVRWSPDYGRLDRARLLRRVTPSAVAATGDGLPACVSSPRLRGATVVVDQDAFRFDGGGWRHQDLGALTHAGQQEVLSVGVGADTVVRAVQLAGGALVYDLLVYDAASAGAPWSYAPDCSGVPGRAGVTKAMAARFDAGRPEAASRFVLLDNVLRLMRPDGTWAIELTIETVFDDDAIRGLLLFADTYVVFQTAAGVTAHPLVGGGLAAASGIVLPGARLLPGGGEPMAGETAFVTYTGAWGGADAVLTLHRVVAEDVRGALAPLAVQSVTLYAGGTSSEPGTLPYGAVHIGYDHGATTATVSDDGRALAVNHATTREGGTPAEPERFGSVHIYLFGRLTPAETPALAYPVGADTNAAANLGHLAGTPYATRTQSSNGGVTLADTLWWWVSPGLAGGGTYRRPRKEATAADGVPGERTLSYDAATGLVTELSATLAGNVQMRTTYTRWWEKYDPTRALHLLAPVVLCMQHAGTALVRASATTWTGEWGDGAVRWAPRAAYVATGPTAAAFDRWSGSPAPAPVGWQLTQLIARRSAAGVVTLTRDALGRAGSSICTTDGTRPLAAFANADVASEEAYHFNCEPYEESGPWAYRGGSLAAHLVADESVLGTRCLRMAPDPTGATGPTAAWTPAAQDRAYLFAFWMQAGPGFAAAPGEATFVLEAHAAGVKIGSLTLTLGGTEGTWQYRSVVVPLPDWRSAHAVAAGAAATITARGTNSKVGVPVLLDGLRFAPCDADFYAEVLDPATALPRGSQQPNGAIVRLVRDAEHIVTTTIGPDPASARIAIPAFARLANSERAFESAFPNTLLEAQAGRGAIHEDFEPSDAARWTLPAGWTMAQGRLAFGGTHAARPGSRATLGGFAHPDYVAVARFRPVAGTAADVGIGCGNVLAQHLAASDTWVLLSTTDGEQWESGPAHSGPLGRGDVVFALLDRRVTLFVAGRQVFSETVPPQVTPDGTLNVYLTAAGAFSDLVAVIDPDLRLTMVDGAGIAQQAIDLRSSSRVDAAGALEDERGLPAYAKNPVEVDLDLDGNRIAGGPDAYLPPIGGAASSRDRYVRFGNGSPFVRAQAKPDPLARLGRLGLPGDPLAIGGGHSTEIDYARNAAGGPMADLVPAAAAGDYELVAVTDPDGHPNYRLVSTAGDTIAHRVELGATQSVTHGFTFDAIGRLTAVAAPNGYAESDQAAHWRTTFTRDFLSQVVEIDSPDANRLRRAYDAGGRERLTQDAADAQASPERVRYVTYDGLDRIVEQGVADVGWEAALPHVDDRGWPDATVTHRVECMRRYDVAPEGRPATCTEGRLVEATAFAADATATCRETYGYDVRGDVISHWTLAPGYGSESWLSTMTYDQRGNVTQIAYPKALDDGSPPLLVAYRRDREGHIVAVGEPARGGFVDPLNPPPDRSDRYARFEYGPDGSLAAATYGSGDSGQPALRVEHEHSPAGWPLATRSAVYGDELAYFDGGYADGGSHTGRPAAARRSWRAGASALYPVLDQTARFARDPAGRLVAASPYLAPRAPAAQMPIALDANGNLLTVARGDSSASYRYPAPATGLGAEVQPSDRLQDVVVTLASSCTFGAAPAPGWSWGASDGGPGGASVVELGRDGGACLRVAGGLLGMAGELAYRGYVDAHGSYTLRYWLKADPAFAAQRGPAGWYVELHGPGGVVASRLASAISSPPTEWTEQVVSFDLAGFYAAQADHAQIVEVRFVLRNHRGQGDAALGAPLLVDDLALTGSTTLGAIEYDGAGRVTSLAGAGLGNMAYAPDSNTLAAYRTAAVGGYDMRFALGDTGEYAVREAAPVDPAGVAGTTLYLRAPDGKLLMRMQRWGGSVSRRLYIEGPRGTFAVDDDGKLSYLVRGSDGGVRAIVDERGSLTQHYDDDAFGAVQRCAAGGADPFDRLDPLAPLDAAPPAPYAPWLGRSLAPRVSECPPEPAAAAAIPAGGYQGAADLLPRHLRLAVNYVWMHLVEGPRYMSHNAEAWFVQAMVPKVLAVLAATRPTAAQRLIGAAAAVVATPFAYGNVRFAYERWTHRDAAGRGLRTVSSGTLVEDIYHGEGYGPLESIGAKRLRLRSVEPLAPGFYIYVVDGRDDFVYREMSDRCGGTELYVRHSMLAGGGGVRAAGMMAVFGDEIVLTNQSGHYAPTREMIHEHAVPVLRAAGYDQYTITVCAFEQLDLKQKLMDYRRRTGMDR